MFGVISFPCLAGCPVLWSSVSLEGGESSGLTPPLPSNLGEDFVGSSDRKVPVEESGHRGLPVGR